jgi:hypothetical protein
MTVSAAHFLDIFAASNERTWPVQAAANLWKFTGLFTAVSGKPPVRRVITVVLFLFGLALSGILIAWLFWGREKMHAAAKQPDGQAEMSLTPTRAGWSLDLPDKQ